MIFKIFIFDINSENSVGSESLIKGEGGGNESKKSEKITTKSVILPLKINSINFFGCFQDPEFHHIRKSVNK